MNSAIYVDISWSIHFNKHDKGSPQMTVNCSWPWSYINIFLMIKYLIFEILPSEKHCCCKVVLLCCPLVNFLFENFALEILWTNEWNENDAMMRFPVFLLNQHYPIHGILSFYYMYQFHSSPNWCCFISIWFQMFICK